ncbi:MAG TPA: extracellular solute-binding protein [Bauldia sp.]|nr:extracellular solute-binding protein [Bauldia sp.]
MKPRHLIKASLGLTVLAAPFLLAPAYAQDDTVTISHYFTGELGQKGITEIFAEFKDKTGLTVADSPIGHEDFKTGILVRAAGNSLPDVFSYWAGARTQFVVDAGNIMPIDDLWSADKLDDVVAKSVADGATLYNGKRYLVPFGYHYAGMFYNPKVMADAGITTMPKTWDDLLAACKSLRDKGVDPIALGSKNRWPAQFWFDYLLLRTAGPDYRAKLMAGTASYTDPEVKTAMGLWKDLVDANCFAANSNANDWTDASDQVARGDAAMTLMGTWITGYWNGQGLQPGTDYDFFEFPVIADGVPNAVVGPVDGWLIAANAKNPDGARKLVSWLASDPAVQAKWAQIQGALSPNVKVDASTYTPVMQRALAAVNNADAFAFNYDLATPPPVAEVGLNMFAEFMNDSSDIDALMEKTQTAAADAFKE